MELNWRKQATKPEPINFNIEPSPVAATPIVRIPCQWKDCDCEPLVKRRDKVAKGQVVALTEGVAVHSPVSGTVREIDVVENCEGVNAVTITIAKEDDEENNSLPSYKEPEKLGPEKLYAHLKAAGIITTYKDVATHVMALPSIDSDIKTILLHGCAISPDISKGRELPTILQEVVSGLKVLFQLYPEAELIWQSEKGSLLEEVLSQFPQARIMPVRQGSLDFPAKLVMEELLGHNLEAGSPPMAEGLLPVTFQQARAVYRAVFLGEPYMEQLIRVEGNGVKKPGYYSVPLGVDLGAVLLAAEVDQSQLAKVVVGCALNGTSVSRLDLPIGKSVSSIITFSKDEIFHYQNQPCIHCGRCYQVCPLKLLPQRIAAYGENNMWDLAKEEGALICNECGRCSYICPAKRPLVQLIKLAKQMIDKNQKN